jgi:hypothetical protein
MGRLAVKIFAEPSDGLATCKLSLRRSTAQLESFERARVLSSGSVIRASLGGLRGYLD